MKKNEAQIQNLPAQEEKFSVNRAIRKNLKIPTKVFDLMKSMGIEVIDHTKKSLVVLALLILSLSGCKKENIIETRQGQVSFEINAFSVPQNSLETTSKSNSNVEYSKSSFVEYYAATSYSEFLKSNPVDVSKAQLGIDGLTNPEYLVDIQLVNGLAKTPPIQLSLGTHSLTSLTLLSSEDIVLYSAVAENAELSSFVSYTVPSSFVVPTEGNLAVPMDVVALDSWTPADFGFDAFAIGIINVNQMYFYGLKNDLSPSVMSIEVLDGENSIYYADSNPTTGFLKILYPDVNSEDNATEIYKFNLTIDGVLYTQSLSVEQLQATTSEFSQRQVILFNVNGSGYHGFEELIYGSLSFNLLFNNGQSPFPADFQVKNSLGEVVYEGPSPISYIDAGGETNDATEMYTIKMTYSWWENGAGVFEPGRVKNATVSVLQLKSATNPTILNQQINQEIWWLFI